MGVRVVDAIHVVLGHQQHLSTDLQGPQRCGGVGGHEGVPGAGGKEHHPTFLQMADGPAADVRFGYRLYLQGALGPGNNAPLLQGILKRQAVDDGGQHTGVIRSGPVHPLELGGLAPPDVATSDNHRHLHTQAVGLVDLLGQIVDCVGFNTEGGGAFEGFSADFEQHPTVTSWTHRTCWGITRRGLIEQTAQPSHSRPL